MNLYSDFIRIRCDNEQEWIALQEYLFSKDIGWTGGQYLLVIDHCYPRYIYLNYINSYLCYSYGKEIENEIYRSSDIKFYTTTKTILRKKKLEKINES
jgi:hypothetical protein